jgi:hypothetical protein
MEKKMIDFFFAIIPISAKIYQKFIGQKMLRLSSLEWDLVLVDNFTGSELAVLMHVCKAIRCIIEQNPNVMRLYKSRHTTVKPFGIIENKWKQSGESKYEKLRLRILGKNPPNYWGPDGFRVLQSPLYILAMSDAYTFDEDFFHVGLYLEHKLGKQNCIVQHWHFNKLNHPCLIHGDIGKECCCLKCHRGHVIFIKIRKDCCKKKFLDSLPVFIETEFDTFIVNNYSKEEEIYHSEVEYRDKQLEIMCPKPSKNCGFRKLMHYYDKRRKLSRSFDKIRDPFEKLERSFHAVYKDFELREDKEEKEQESESTDNQEYEDSEDEQEYEDKQEKEPCRKRICL